MTDLLNEIKIIEDFIAMAYIIERKTEKSIF